MTLGLRFAAAQTIPAAGDVRTNVAQHVALADLARRHEVRLLVFPELSLTGYELERAEELAFRPGDPRLRPLIAAAERGAMFLVVGAPVRVDGRLHIGAMVLAPDGSTALYTKRHLGAFGPEAAVDGHIPPGEPTVFEPGDADPLVDVDGRSAAIAVCADAGHPEHARAAAARGATTYLASVFIIASAFEAESARLRRHACEHSMAAAMANFGGPSGGLRAAGRSTVWNARGDALARLGRSDAGLAIALGDDEGVSDVLSR